MIIEGNTESEKETSELDSAAVDSKADGPLVLTPKAKEDDDDAPRGGRHPSSSGRGGRMAELQRQVAELSAERESFRGTTSRLEQQLSELRAKLGAPQQAEPAKGGDEMTSIKAEMNSLLKQVRSGTLSDEAVEVIQRRYAELGEKLEEKKWEAREAKLAEKLKPQQGSDKDPNARMRERVTDMLQEEFPEVLRDARAIDAARAYVDYQVHVEGRPNTLALYREAAAKVAAKRGFGTPSAPTRDRERLAGIPSGQRGSATQRKDGSLVFNNPKHKAMLRGASSIIKQMGGSDDDLINGLKED